MSAASGAGSDATFVVALGRSTAGAEVGRCDVGGGNVTGGSSSGEVSLTCAFAGPLRPPGRWAGVGMGRAWNDMASLQVGRTSRAARAPGAARQHGDVV